MLTALAAMRWKQWIKNTLIFAPWFAAGGNDFSDFEKLAFGFVAFSLVSSSIYIFNDLRDIEEDRRHPEKSQRPLAAGKISVKKALALAITLLLVGLPMTFLFLPVESFVLLLTYLLLSIIYIFAMRSISLLDLFFISVGFVLRVLFGGVTTGIPVSPWLLFVIGFFAFFVASGKRFSEIRSGNAALTKRRSLEKYDADYLQTLLITSLASVILAYALWTIEGASNQSLAMLSLIPFAYIMFRYLQKIMVGEAEAPEQVLLHDRSLILASGIWILVFYLRFV